MSSSKKSITGTDDLLKKVFDSPEMDEVVARMKRVQTVPSKATDLKPIRKAPDKETGNRSDKTLDNELSDAISDGMSDYPTDCPSDHPSDSPIVRPSVRPSLGTTDHPTDYPTGYPTHGPTDYTTDWKNKASDPVWALTHRQAKVLFYLINQPDSISQRERISRETEIPVPTIKHCIRVLAADGFISKPAKYVNRSFQGFSYTVNQGLCRQFLEKRGHEFSGPGNYPAHYPSDCPTRYPALGTSDGTSHGLSDRLSDHYSSSIESKTTTTDLENLLKTDPELGYWQEKGLQCQQVLKWMEETGMSRLVMLQSLKHCRFDMVDREIEASKPVQNVFNWFYTIIKRSGHYPKPTGYRSWNEKMIEIEQALLDEQEAEIRRLEELRTRRYRLEADRRFQEMMNEPDGETYKAVYARLSKFERELGEGIPFEKAMRARFDEHFASSGA